MPASSFWSDDNKNMEKGYKEFIFDNSMKPIFVINLKKLKNMAIKLCGSDIYKNEFKSIAFNAIDNSINNFIVSNIQQMFSLVVTLSKNTWLGQERIELRIEDVINI